MGNWYKTRTKQGNSDKIIEFHDRFRRRNSCHSLQFIFTKPFSIVSNCDKIKRNFHQEALNDKRKNTLSDL